jgi:hypothetical protein
VQCAAAKMATLAKVSIWNVYLKEKQRPVRVRIPPSPPVYPL